MKRTQIPSCPLPAAAFPTAAFPAAAFLATTVLAVALLAAPGPARAQAGPMRKDSHGNLYDRRLPNLGAHNVKEARTKRECPNLRFESEVNYPAATGNPELDRRFEAAAEADLASSFDDLLDTVCDGVRDQLTGSYRRRFEARSPSPGVLSLVFPLTLVGVGAPSARRETEVIIVDLASGAPMELKDVFPDHGRAAPALWAMIARGWCASPDNPERVLPSYYGLPERSNSCRGGPPPLPPEIARDPSVFKGFGHVFLTAEGLTVRLNGWEAWGPNAVDENLHLGKAELIRIGARPEIWR